jgi:hypothetical protein
MTMHDPEPTLAEAAAMLAAASVVDVETDRGESVELWTISSEDAPREPRHRLDGPGRAPG